MIKSIIVEDEPKAIGLLKNYIDRIDFVCLVGTFRNPMQALHFLKQEEVQLIFLDINMPILSGIDFYKSLKHPPAIIFTTAYPNYAVEGFELEATDYLVKPILFPRFLKACNRVQNLLHDKNGSYSSRISKLNDLVYVKSGTSIHNFLWREIKFLQKDENYVIYHKTSGKQLLSRQTLSDLEEIFPFYICRIHKSYAVSLIELQEIGSESIKVNDMQLPLGRTYKKKFILGIKDILLLKQLIGN